MQKYFLETKKKKTNEEEMMKLQLEKRRKDNEREFNRNLNEANLICEKLGIEEQIRDEYYRVNIIYQQNKILSRVYINENRYDEDIEYKKFLIRKIKKFKENQLSTKQWRDDENLDKTTSFSPDKKIVRNERQDIIKKYLIEAIRLKNKLKKQITSLREKPVIDENFILMSFKQMNLS